MQNTTTEVPTTTLNNTPYASLYYFAREEMDTLYDSPCVMVTILGITLASAAYLLIPEAHRDATIMLILVGMMATVIGTYCQKPIDATTGYSQDENGVEQSFNPWQENSSISSESDVEAVEIEPDSSANQALLRNETRPFAARLSNFVKSLSNESELARRNTL